MTNQILTWDNGKPRSRGGPFDILYEPRKAPLVVSVKEQQKKVTKVKANLTRNNVKHSIALPSQSDADTQNRIKKAQI